jgi:7,8-dihydropterin-6-yl-methyl-4-(beta-D-ribofuranosyl)aminobenzene 5'-phosphate synthase
MNSDIRLVVLVENTASGPGLSAEHGLSFWIEYGDKRILFDTGQSDLFIRNAQTLGINLGRVDAIVLSHGHYDHTGGLAAALDVGPGAIIFLHPEALKTKFTRQDTNVRSIGIPDLVKEIVHTQVNKGKVFLTEEPTEVSAGLYVTGRIPRVTDFEGIDSSFFVDKYCRDVDVLRDDQAIFFESPKGLVVLVGCAHSGVANTMHYIAKLSGKKQTYAVLGGMHLWNAGKERIEQTINVFREYDVQKIGMAHCTGENAKKQFQRAFPDRCFVCSAGTQVNLGDELSAHLRI